MKSIYKYTLFAGGISITLPKNAEVLSAMSQNHNIVIYALVDIKEKETFELEYFVYGTGNFFESKEGFKFLNTVQFIEDGLVFHVFIKE